MVRAHTRKTVFVLCVLFGTSLVGPASGQDGELLYTAYCESCHGFEGTGGVVGRPLQGARWCSIDEARDRFILGMEFLQILSNDELRSISDYLNSFAVDGEDRYVVTCLGCHGKEGEGGRVARNIVGEDPDDIVDAILTEEAMGYLRRCLKLSDLNQISNYLHQVGD